MKDRRGNVGNVEPTRGVFALSFVVAVSGTGNPRRSLGPMQIGAMVHAPHKAVTLVQTHQTPDNTLNIAT